MKKLHLILALILLCLAIVPAQAQTNPTPVAAAPRVLTSDENKEIKQLNDQVISLYQAGKYDEAVKVSEQARQRITNLLGPDSTLLIVVYQNLGEVQIALKKFGPATNSLREALRIQESKLGADALPLAATLLRLGFAAFNNKQPDVAEKSFARSLAIREQKLPPNSPLLVEALELSAQAQAFAKHWDIAEPLYRRALEIKEKMPQVPADLLLSQMRYECLLLKLKRQTEYDALQEKRRLANEKLPPDNPNATVQGGILNGKAVQMPPPIFPAEAKRNRIQGAVSIRVLLDKEGRVIHACPISGPPLLQETAEAAVYKSLFKPGLVLQKPVNVIGIVNYNFVAW